MSLSSSSRQTFGSAAQPRTTASAGPSRAWVTSTATVSADVAVGAPFSANNGRASSGSAHVLYGPFAGADLDVGAADVRGFRIDGAAEGDFAAGSVAAGDVNGDRRADLLIGSPEADYNDRDQSGSLYVVFGGARRGQLDLATLTAGFRVDGAADGDQAGWSAAAPVT